RSTSGLARSSHHVTFSRRAFNEFTFQVAIRMFIDYSMSAGYAPERLDVNLKSWSHVPIQRVRRFRFGGDMQMFSAETSKFTPVQTRFHMLKMEDTFREQVLGMAATLVQLVDLRDCYTGGHSTRVAEYSHRIAIELGMNDADTETLLLAASLHDVGKIG